MRSGWEFSERRVAFFNDLLLPPFPTSPLSDNACRSALQHKQINKRIGWLVVGDRVNGAQ